MIGVSAWACPPWRLAGVLSAGLFGFQSPLPAAITHRVAAFPLVHLGTLRDGLPDGRVKAILRARDGRL